MIMQAPAAIVSPLASPPTKPAPIAHAEQFIFCDCTRTAELIIERFDFPSFVPTAITVGHDTPEIATIRKDAEVFVVTNSVELLDPVNVATLLGREVRCYTGTIEALKPEEIVSALEGAVTVHPVVYPAESATDAIAVRVDAYYDSGRKEFILRNSAGRWLSHTADGFRMLVKENGIAPIEVTPIESWRRSSTRETLDTLVDWPAIRLVFTNPMGFGY
jgi:hypothetical protein